MGEPRLPIGEAGSWAQEKHRLLAAYIEATWGVRRKLKRIAANPGYVDLYSGPGRAALESGEIVDGSPLVAWKAAQKHLVPFTSMFLFDSHKGYAEAAEVRLRELDAPATGIRGKASEGAKWSATRLDPDSYHLVFADPYNLADLPWQVFDLMKGLRHVDFIVHFSEADVTRNLERYFQEESPIPESFAPDWRKRIGGMRDPVQMRGLFFDHWVSLFEREGFQRGEYVPMIANTKGAPLYRLVCFSRHPLGKKIWSSMSRDPQRDLFS